MSRRGGHLEKVGMTLHFRSGWSDMYGFWPLYAEYHTDYGNMAEKKPEVEFQYGRRLFFQTESGYISAGN